MRISVIGSVPPAAMAFVWTRCGGESAGDADVDCLTAARCRFAGAGPCLGKRSSSGSSTPDGRPAGFRIVPLFQQEHLGAAGYADLHPSTWQVRVILSFQFEAIPGERH